MESNTAWYPHGDFVADGQEQQPSLYPPLHSWTEHLHPHPVFWSTELHHAQGLQSIENCDGYASDGSSHIQHSSGSETDIETSSTFNAQNMGFTQALVPQRPYSTIQPTENWTRDHLIQFSTRAGGGISLADSLRKDYTQMVGRDDWMNFHSTSISLRFEWSGYDSWSCQIKTHNWQQDRKPIQRSKLATEVSKATVRFIKHMQNEHTSNELWKVGPGFIEPHHLELVSLNRVSLSSWQLQLRLRA